MNELVKAFEALSARKQYLIMRLVETMLREAEEAEREA